MDRSERASFRRLAEDVLVAETGAARVVRRDPGDLPDIVTEALDLPQGYVGTVAGEGVSWRLAAPAARARRANS